MAAMSQQRLHARRSVPGRTLAGLVLCALVLTSVRAASTQTLLDEPPRELSFRIAPSATPVDLLQPLSDGAADPGPYKLYSTGPWGQWRARPVHTLEWSRVPGPPLELTSAAPAGPGALLAPGIAPELVQDDAGWEAERSQLVFQLREETGLAERYGARAFRFEWTGASLQSDGYGALFALPPIKPVVDWRCRRRPVLILRPGNESDRFELVRCDGGLAAESIDRLSLLARPPEVERPGALLPDEPVADAWDKHREWAPGVRVVHPRLVWVLQQLADAFPYKPIVIYSGYRPMAEVNDGSGHRSLHASGRALDVAVGKVSNEDLFKVCTTIRGVGCGFYPNNKFVHIDVRRAGPGEAFWIDGSLPGEPSRYLEEYPGLVQKGQLAFPKPNAKSR